MASQTIPKLSHLMTLGDLSVSQIQRVLSHSQHLRFLASPWLLPHNHPYPRKMRSKLRLPPQSLFNKTVSLVFSKRSTRTRLAAETSASLLGGKSLFLGKEDVQLGVNESLRDTARVVGGMTDGVFARVNRQEELDEWAKYSPVPIINALSDLWHPTQVLADLLTLHQHAHLFSPPKATSAPETQSGPNKKQKHDKQHNSRLPPLRPLTITYVGDSANVLHDMLVTFPRLGHNLRVASPDKYRAPEAVWDKVKSLGLADKIYWTDDPKDAVKGAEVVITDTWISMGQEHEKAQRLQDFAGYQVTEQLCKEGGAHPDWKFLHCLPRKQDEVDDEVFYGPRSLVFPEADNRRWTIMALFDLMIGKWELQVPEGKNVVSETVEKEE